MFNLIPKPSSVIPTEGTFNLSSETLLQFDSSNGELKSLANYFSKHVQNATGWTLAVQDRSSNTNSINLELDDFADLGEEDYKLNITSDEIRLCARKPAGLFYAIQTFLQMIPPAPSGTVDLPAIYITDTPRFLWRGAMLDVARHFFGKEDVKRYIDLISHYKMNRLHLHLTDDQGWRIEIKSWPKLTEIGAQTQVGGNGGGFYTQEQYKEIVDYARSQYVTIVPEIDTPGHTNAALASYPELNCSGRAPASYEGTEVGFSTLCIDKEITYQFLDDAIGELTALTPGPYIHIGGDEAKSTPDEEYRRFIKRIQEIVVAHGKTTIGWAEIGAAPLLPGTIAQHWMGTSYQEARMQGAKIILSPANKTYVDMKYHPSTPLGLDWIGYISVKDSYDWEPGTYMHLLDENGILGIEAPMWTETLLTMKDIEYLAFPRMLCLAELAWSPKGRDWEEFRQRLATHGKRMEAMGINFYRSPEIDWGKVGRD